MSSRFWNPYAYAERKQYNRRKSEYLNEIPQNAYQIEYYHGCYFDRYWFDPNTYRMIMVTRRNKVKYVLPLRNGNHYTVAMIDSDGRTHNFGYKQLYEYLCEIVEEEEEEES